MEPNSARVAPLERRIAQLRRAYGRGLKRKPSLIEAGAMMRAATLSARSEAALTDPNISPNDAVRLDGAASRARADMAKVLATKPAQQLGPDSLRAYAASKYASAT